MKTVNTAVTQAELMERGRLLSQEQVLQMWPVTREYLSRLTNHKNENKRLPSYQYGRRRMYDFQELMNYRDNHRYTPIKKRGSQK